MNPFFTKNSDFELQMAEPFANESKNITFALESSESLRYFFCFKSSFANGPAIPGSKSEFLVKKGFTVFVYQIQSSSGL